MSEEHNGQLNLFGNGNETFEVGDCFVNGDGDTYIIAYMYTSFFQGWILLERNKGSKFIEVIDWFKKRPGMDWDKKMSELVAKFNLIKVGDEGND